MFYVQLRSALVPARGGSVEEVRSLSLFSHSLITMIITMTACGGGSSGGGPPPDPGTPLGTFNVTVHAADSAGVISHTLIVTLKVQ